MQRGLKCFHAIVIFRVLIVHFGIIKFFDRESPQI